MPRPVRWPAEAWIPLVAGLFWLWNAPEHGFVGFLFSVVPGGLLLAAGVAMLLMRGDLRISQLGAFGGAVGVVVALPAFIAVGPLSALALIAVSAAGFLAAGAHTVRLESAVDEVPDPIPSLWLSAQVALDEALLGSIMSSMPLPGHDDHGRIERELSQAREQFTSAGWLDKPASYHRAPPPLEDPRLRTRRAVGIDYEHLSFESAYEPHDDEPGRDRWLAHASNRTGHAWVLRHREEGRPWLVCVHGYQMGWPLVDLLAFEPAFLHERLGMNLLIPTLPLHGYRKAGRRSGDGYLNGDVLDSVHAEAQAMWDMRRLLAWVRAQGAPAVGAIGYSLGGYNASLLSALDDDLACVIAGVPLADFTRAVYRHAPPLQLRSAEAGGIREKAMREVLSVVSPLHLETLVPHERRSIFAAVADRLVTPDQVRDLWLHWDRPRIEWYQGGHLTFRAHPAVRRMVTGELRESGLAV